MIKKDVIVVGAGPAGMAASIEAAKRGCQVTMIDSNRVAGGQLYKQIHKFFGSSAHKAGTRGKAEHTLPFFFYSFNDV